MQDAYRSRIKGEQTMEFGQLIQYTLFFLKEPENFVGACLFLILFHF